MAVMKTCFPQPDVQRSEWLNLNGTWEFSLNEKTYAEKIEVPYPWGSPLSGITEEKDGTGYYRRTVCWNPVGEKIWLVFGAVDYTCEVRCNGTVIGTNKGGYSESDLRKALQSDEVLDIFADIRDYMVPFDNGDLLRIPFAGELFDKLPSWCEPDDHKQWPLMQDRRNRLALRCEDYEWGWINNKTKSSSTHFCAVDGYGRATHWGASAVIGVRPVFQIKEEER